MRGKEKAAILLIALGPEVWWRTSSSSCARTRSKRSRCRSSPPSRSRRRPARKSCTTATGWRWRTGYLSNGGAAYAEEMLTKALGAEKAGRDHGPPRSSSVRPRHFDFLKDTDPYQLVNFIQDEQPQAIALILSHLPAPTAAKILAILQPEQRAEVAMRIATMERTPPEVIEGVEAVLRRRVSTILQSDYSTAGGVEHLAALLANVDRSTERVILDHLDKNAPELAAEVRKLTFTFDNLIQLDDPVAPAGAPRGGRQGSGDGAARHRRRAPRQDLQEPLVAGLRDAPRRHQRLWPGAHAPGGGVPAADRRASSAGWKSLATW